MTEHRDICGNPNCASCKNKRHFDMPEEIPSALIQGRLALFAGAGISTEALGVFPTTFYQDIAEELGIPPSRDLSFPSLMSLFCKSKGRRELLIRIKKRFDFLQAFPEMHLHASRFHRELSTIPFLDQIFTTNWDELFEAECCATPVVSGEDFAFWDIPGRKVFKLHGSVSHYGSIVATEEDYESCRERLRSGLIGSTLKLALATKTVVFAGYSVRDPDFLQTLSLVKEEVGELAPPMYAVTLHDTDQARLESLGLRVIVTDATHFVAELKRRLVKDKVMLDDSWQDDLSEVLDLVSEAHMGLSERFSCVDYPALIYTLSYQDGLRHGIERLLARACSGEYSHHCQLTRAIRVYDDLRAKKQKERRYGDIAYIDGYINALFLPLLTSEERLSAPLYYLLGSKEYLYDLEDFEPALQDSRNLHRAAYKHAESLIRRHGNDRGIVFHHPPVL